VLVEQTEQLALEGYAQPEIFAALRKDLSAADGAARLVDGVGLAASGELAALWDMLDVLVEEPVAFEDLAAIADTHTHATGAIAALRALGGAGRDVVRDALPRAGFPGSMATVEKLNRN
jgi:hypothetical protein